MAENATRAFGRYLKTLRERRGLSLQDVCSLSQTFADTINKGYLSRCENGHQRLAFSKLIPLSRIYEVPANVLLERMELDLELESIGGPETNEQTFAELASAGSKAMGRGSRWHVYGYLRDALARAGIDPVSKSFADQAEQLSIAEMNCGTASADLGRLQYALHEFRYLYEHGSIRTRFTPILLERLSRTYRGLNKLDDARKFADLAIDASVAANDKGYVGYIFGNRACQAVADEELSKAATFYQKAYRAYRGAGLEFECATSLNNLAQVYFDLKRYGAARRAILAADRLSQTRSLLRPQALGRILLGEIEEVENRVECASQRWKEAADIARHLNDKVLRFKAEYQLLRMARRQGNGPAARSIERRLTKLANWIPKNTPELREFSGSGQVLQTAQPTPKN